MVWLPYELHQKKSTDAFPRPRWQINTRHVA